MNILQKFLSLKPRTRYIIIIGSIVLLIGIIGIIVIIVVAILASRITGTNKGAYLKTPDASKLEFRVGTGIGGFHSTYSVESVRSLMAYAGFDGQRKKLPEYHLERWGYVLN